MRCKHEEFVFHSEDAYLDVTMTWYKCSVCGRRGSLSRPTPTEVNIHWEDSL